VLLDIYLIFHKPERGATVQPQAGGKLKLSAGPALGGIAKGKGIDELSLAKLLRGYGVRPRTIWVGECSAKGYVKDNFKEAFGRYITKWQAKALLEEVVAEAKPRHGRNYNLVCCDGHVEGIDLTRVFDPTNYAVRWNNDYQPHTEVWGP
jgi:hypothetical protein